MTIFDLLQSSSYPQKPILEKLIMHQLRLSKEQLFTHLDDTISDSDLSRIHQSYTRYVIDKKPLEYILGYVTFAGLQFTVTPATIIPRPETEYMIEAVREFLEGENDKQTNTPFEKGEQGGDLISHFHTSALPQSNTSSLSPFNDSTMQRFNLLDIGTGSGILGLATLYHCGHYIDHAYLCDLSINALDVARKNADTLLSTREGGVGGGLSKVSFLHCSLLDHPTLKQLFLSKQTDLPSSEEGVGGGLSNPNSTNPILIVANLPYIPDEMFATNADDHITKREPTMAFVGGNDGLDLYRQMLDQIITYISPLSQRGGGGDFLPNERHELFEKEQLEKRGLTRVGGHQPYNKDLKERARIMRTNMTASEKHLRKAYLQRCGKTVQRQKIIDHFIVDFYIAAHRLAIEVDGRSHDDPYAKEYDAYRTQVLEKYGVRVMRFTNEQVLYHLDTVIQQLEKTYSLPPLGKRGYGSDSMPNTGKRDEGGFYTLPNERGVGGDSLPPFEKGGQGGIVMFLEMMTRQAKILADEYQDYFTFEEIKTFHGNIRIVKGQLYTE